ncbi:RsmF rRNA methyltransferase first C-terminal domain-containing protein [Apilactobacillus xinyiensis]|uniref:RsmF rRNA methyltransferase first C-terminal domain-containing protein n=1 Tax=Apilactobacillus xinyiensis TaxID=2841032 RepID=UPI002010205D|nr:RsmF rRNA methyltransferase first C-terminal domain-containing protein [Apilactobacillus xinyiensis]MCL0329415.1 RsmF rRNA methyltransferase first C-terminal domain-containing protein [Apilactobacillus xinyiensis]
MKLPNEFIKKYQKLLGEDADSFFKGFNNPVKQGFRVNPLKEKLPQSEKLNAPIEYCQYGYFGSVNGKSVDHQSGALYSQEPSAMYVGEVVNAQPGEKILDLCAAPGGKTTHIASYMQNSGVLVTNEIDKKRAKILVENVERFGITNALILNENPKAISKYFPKYFDKIAIDAPCSGEGMFRKNPDAMNYWSQSYVDECASRQKDILRMAMKTLKPGGQIIYSTCTFAPEEDEQIIEWLMDNYNLEIVPIKKYHGMDSGNTKWSSKQSYDLSGTVRLFPHHFDGEGHFIAKLINKDTGNPKKIKKQIDNVSVEQRKLWNEFRENNLLDFNPIRLLAFGDQLFAYPNEIPQLKGLKVMRPGLDLGTFKKNRFEPSYALSLALRTNQVKHTINISFEDWKNYVHGDVIKCSNDLSKGWYQLLCDNQSVGFGKVVNGTIKNFFPKGLRFNV